MKKRITRVAYGLLNTDGLSDPSRRKFLQTGGMVIAFAGLGGHKGMAQAIESGQIGQPEGDGFAPDGFIRIGTDGSVMFICPAVEMGQGVFTGLATLIAEELGVPLEQITVYPAPPNQELYAQPILGSQTTGNSTTIRGFWGPMRQAGAAARVMLTNAAAAEWGVPADEVTARDGVLSHAASGNSAGFGDLVEAAARQEVPAAVPLKTADQFDLIGQELPRVDTAAKVRGETVYGIDVKVEGMRIATVAASPVDGGRLAAVDDTAARQVRGVVDVLTIDNAVMVVGEHFWAARKGLAALEIEWDYGDRPLLNTAQMLADLEAARGEVAPVVATDEGDVEAAFGDAAQTLEAVYTLPFLSHASLEPINTTIHVHDGTCEIWVGTQVPVSAQMIAAGVLEIEPQDVIVHNHQIGGGFGRRLTVESIEQAAAFAAQVDYPVKIIWTREEDIRHDIFRPLYRDEISAALGPDGRPLALVDHIAGGSVMNTFIPGGLPEGALDTDAVSGVAETPYHFDNVLVDWTRHDPPVPIGFWRGVGETHNAFVLESFIDEMAHAAGADPVEYRLDLLRDNPRGANVVRTVAERSGWGGDLPPRTGRGISFHEAFSSPLAMVVEAHVTEEGDIRLRRITAAIDVGVAINPNTIRAQIEGGALFGLSAAMYNEILFENGAAVQSNFNDYRQIRIDEVPPIEVIVIEGTDEPGGVGESGTVSAAPSLGNAIFAATGIRLRDLPFRKDDLRTGEDVG